MKIQIKDLGAIKEGTFDFSKKLNIFCGPNGTGKTYVAYVIYGLIKSQIHYKIEEKLINGLIDNKKVSYVINFDLLNEYRDNLLENFKDEFDSLFGIGEQLAEQFFAEANILFGESEEEFKQQIVQSEFKTIVPIGKIDIEVEKIKGTDYLVLELSDKTISSKDIQQLTIFLFSSLLSLIATYPVGATYILPVERNSIFTFSKELSIRKQEAVDHFHAMTGKDKVDKLELIFNRTTRYPLPIKDGLLIADDLSEVKKNTSKYFDFATEIENELLHGKVQITSEGDIQFKPDKAPKRLLPIHMTASIIKSLSSLVIYLKHIARENDLIIIDEPEINLHPDNQVKLTRLFARLINKGFRLLISTHSDYIVREFNNLIMLSSDKPGIHRLRKQFNYGEDEFILKDDVEVHYFNYPNKRKGNKQVKVKLIEIDESGFEIPSVDETIDEQNGISEELYYSLKYGDSYE